MAEKQPLIDTSKVGVRRNLTRNINAVYERATPQEIHEGRLWYPKVHEAVAKGIRGTSLSPIHGAGLVAAVSPNMDWDKRNIDAFGELNSLKERDWHEILNKGNRSRIQGMGINSASDANLAKAHRIMQGEHPDDVLPRASAPKTNSFAHNINLEPEHVTIDGRAHDVAANRMQGWEQARGIQSAGLKTGKPTRYEHFEQAYHSAAAAHDLTGFEMQAVTWTRAKNEERMGTTKSGQPRKQGPSRQGQSYSEHFRANG